MVELEPEVIVVCPCCSRERPVETMADDKCDFCQREAQREIDRLAFEARLADTSWSGPEGDRVRFDRNAKLDSFAWTLSPASPLSQACQDAFRIYLYALHRMTVDFPTPADVVWPEVPALEYPLGEV